MTLQNYINRLLFLQIQNNQVKLQEENPINNNDLQEVIIKNLPDNAFAFSLDKSIIFEENTIPRKANNEFLGDASSIKKRCDGVIVCEENGITYILICELKSTNLDPQDYEYQLVNVHIFIDYILNLYHTFTKNPVLDTKIEHFLFHKKNSKELTEKDFRKQPVVYEDTKKMKEREVLLFPKHKQASMSNFTQYKIAIFPFRKPKWNYLEWQDLKTLF